MDGLFSFLLLAPASQELVVGLADLGILAAAVFLALLSALALVRQVIFAISVRD